MAVRKAGKTVLDYDPLSWLKDEESAKAQADKVKQVATDEPATKKPAKKKAAAEESGSGKKASGKKQDATAEVFEEPGKTTEEPAISEPPVVVETETESEAEVVVPSADQVQENVAMSEPVNEYYELDTELTMKNVAEVKFQLDQLMQRDTPVAIDAGALRKIDSSGLQMLYSLQKSLAKKRRLDKLEAGKRCDQYGRRHHRDGF